MKELFKRFYRIVLKFILYFLAISVAWVIVYRFVNPPLTPLMVMRYVESSSKNKSINKK